MVQSDGRFAFEGVPAGKVKVRVRAPGFKPKPVELDMTQDVNDVTFVLQK